MPPACPQAERRHLNCVKDVKVKAPAHLDTAEPIILVGPGASAAGINFSPTSWYDRATVLVRCKLLRPPHGAGQVMPLPPLSALSSGPAGLKHHTTDHPPS